jgi:hypothetical protein
MNLHMLLKIVFHLLHTDQLLFKIWYFAGNRYISIIQTFDWGSVGGDYEEYGLLGCNAV